MLRRALLVIFAFACVAAFADDAGLQRCRAIKDAASRLACYDALPLGAQAPAAAPSSPARAPTPQAVPAQKPEQFGFENKRAPVQELDTIESTIPGHFDGWRPNQAIKLANGQVWQIADGSTRFMSLDNAKVVVRRGVLGSFFMEIDRNAQATPRVRRLQ